MNRRTYLAAISTAPLAGCLDGVASAGTSSPVAPDGLQRTVHLESVDDVPADGVAIDATMAEPSVTDDHPARIAVTTTNEGRRRDISVAPGQCCLFNRSGGASDPAGLWLHRVEASTHVERDGDRWTRDAPADQPRAYAAYGCPAKTYAPGESVTTEYHVWDDYRVEGYLRPGTYRFAEPVSVADPGDDVNDADDLIAEFEWGLSVRVERP